MLFCMALAADSISSAKQHIAPPGPCHGRTFTARQFKSFSASVWEPDRWARGKPKKATLAAMRHIRQCASGPGHRAAMRRTWKRDKSAYYKHRKGKLWIREFKPYVYPDGTRWAAPYPIALCESGGDYNVGPSGAYGEIPPFPQWQPPKVQDEIAHRLMEEGKEYSAWVEWEGGCAYR